MTKAAISAARSIIKHAEQRAVHRNGSCLENAVMETVLICERAGCLPTSR